MLGMPNAGELTTIHKAIYHPGLPKQVVVKGCVPYRFVHPMVPHPMTILQIPIRWFRKRVHSSNSISTFSTIDSFNILKKRFL